MQQVRVVLCALALLQFAKGASAPRISQVVPLTSQGFRTIAHRYQQGGLESALFEKQRPGASAVLDDAQKQRIIAMVCSNPPEGRSSGPCVWWRKKPLNGDWSPAWEVKPFGFCSSTTTSSRGGKKMWCVAELNEEYISKMEDVPKTYEKPFDPAEPVICLDEKPVTLHADIGPTSPAKPGREARRHNEYERRGTADVFCAVEPKAGLHFTFATPDRSAFEFARVACELAMQYRHADTVHLVLDKLNIHCLESLTDAFGMDMGCEVWNRFTIHSPPSTEAGSTKRKSKSASSRGNALADAESRISLRFAARPMHGTVE